MTGKDLGADVFAPTIASGDDALDLVRGLLPEIAAASPQTDAARQFSPALVDRMRNMGLFGLVDVYKRQGESRWPVPTV